MKKATIALILALVFSITTGQALAVSTGNISQTITEEASVQRLTLISTISPNLSVSGTTATYSLTVTCVSSVTSTKATLQLQKQNSDKTWSDYGLSWEASSATSYLLTSGTKTVASGGTYRLKVVITASNGTTTGTATEYSA